MTSQRSCILIPLLFGFAFAQYTVEVWEPFDPYHKESPFAYCYAKGANFGKNITSTWRDPKAAGCAVKVTPEHACSPVNLKPINESSCHFHYAVVPVGKCSYSEKAYYVQNTSLARGFDGLIVYNIEGKDPVDMDGGKYTDAVKIPVVMVDYSCMKMIIERYPAYQGYTVQIYRTRTPVDVIFAVLFLLGTGSIAVVFISCYNPLVSCMRCTRDRARKEWARWKLRRKYRKLPTRKFAIGDQPDTCVICIVAFVVGEKLTDLPCKHMYHYKCIVTWFAEHEKCPMCREEVGYDNEASTGEIEGDNRDTAVQNTQVIDDQEPSTSRAQIHRTPARNATWTQGLSEEETGSPREGDGQMSVEAGINEDVMMHAVGQSGQNAAVPVDNPDEPSYSRNDETSLVAAEEGAQPKPSGGLGILRAFRSFVGGSTAASNRLRDGETQVVGGVDNEGFIEERIVPTVEPESGRNQID